MKKCELCQSVARTHCESDQASLCWACDYRVHTANFLVARHSRTLLCHVCQSPTPWSASGTKLRPTVSVCNSCARGCDGGRKGKGGYVGAGDEIESDGGSDGGAETSSDGEVEEVVDNEDNQLVPWSPTTPPPAASSSSNSDAESYCSSSSSSSSSRHNRRKRTHENVSDLRLNANRDHFSPRENVCAPPSTVAVAASPAVSCGCVRGGCGKNLKRRRDLDSSRIGLLGPKSVVDSVKRMHRQDVRSNAKFLKISEAP